jgi:hypothetical protein
MAPAEELVLVPWAKAGEISTPAGTQADRNITVASMKRFVVVTFY